MGTISALSNKRLERTRHNGSSIRSNLGEPLKRSVLRYPISVMASRFVTLLVVLMLVLSSSACRSHKLGEVHVEGVGKPTFRFVGLNVGSLVIYQVPERYLKSGVPLDELKRDNPNTHWFLEGNHEANEPIVYGIVPSGMKEFKPAKPLAEGVIYFASSYVGTEDTGAFVGQYFKITNSQAEEFHGEASK